jgi:hypothetical protein
MLQGLHPSNLRNLQTEQKTCNRWGTTSCLKTYSETRKHILHIADGAQLPVSRLTVKQRNISSILSRAWCSVS